MAKKTSTRSVPRRASALSSHKVCVHCAPIGHTEVMAMLLVAVFGLVAVASMSAYRLEEQRGQIRAQQVQITDLKEQLPQ